MIRKGPQAYSPGFPDYSCMLCGRGTVGIEGVRPFPEGEPETRIPDRFPWVLGEAFQA